MKVGDLVTLSSYCLQTGAMWRWKERIWKQKKPLVGVIIQVEKNPWHKSWSSPNEKLHYFVRWCGEGPENRWGGWSGPQRNGFFLRNDLKFVRGKK